jgi:hypothetical protein
MQGSTSYVNLDIIKELKDKEYSVSVKEHNNDNDTCFTKRLKLSTISSNNLAFNRNISRPRDG